MAAQQQQQRRQQQQEVDQREKEKKVRCTLRFFLISYDKKGSLKFSSVLYEYEIVDLLCMTI